MKRTFSIILISLQFTFTLIAETINVPEDYPNIQEAINAAFEGDIIMVSPGTYAGQGNYNITFYGKQLELRSEAGAENTIIDCQGLGRAFEFNSGEVNSAVLDGFTITNGYVENQMGVGIKCMFSSPTIENCIFEGFDIGWGSILYFTNNTSPVRNCDFTNNNISQGGRVIYFDNSWDVDFRDNYFHHNTLYETAQLMYAVNSEIDLNNCKFFGNNTTYIGLKIWNNTTVLVINCEFKDFLHYGFYESNQCYGAIQNCILRNIGIAALAGYDHCQLHTQSCTIVDNSIGVYSNNCGTGTESSIIYFNTEYQIYIVQGDYPIPGGGYNNIQDLNSGGIYGPVNWYWDGNIDEDPMFINYNGQYAYDLYLKYNSPCIDIGKPDSDYPGQDILGNPRVYNGTRDMGAVEYQGNILDLYVTSEHSEICEGETSQLNAFALGGSGNYTYSWTSTPEGFESSVQNPVVSPEINTIYHLEVSDGSLTNNTDVEIIVHPLPNDAESITGNTDVCKGDQNIIYAVPEIENAETYNWSLPEGFVITSGENTNEVIVTIGSNAESGQISVEGINDCGSGASSSKDISVHFITADAGIDQTISYSSSTMLSGNAENGSGNYSWNWEPDNLLIDANIQNPETVDLTSNTAFILTVTDNSYGCSDEDEMNVFVETDELSVVATVDPEEIFSYQTAQLDAIVSGGLLEYNYSWTSYPEGFISDIQNPEVSPNYTTVYYIDVEDGASSVSDSVMLIVFVPPAIPNQPIGTDTVELANNQSTPYYTPYIPGALTYNWELSPEEAGTLETNENNVVIHWNPEFSGWCYLSVNAVNEYGESEYSETLEIYIDYLIGVDALISNDVFIYPNPVRNLLRVSGTDNYSEYLIRNNLGQIVIQEELDKTNEINTAFLQNGLYFIQFKNQQNSITKKFVKK